MDTIKSESEDLVNWFYGPPWKRAKRPLLPKKSDAEAITADKNSSAYSNVSMAISVLFTSKLGIVKSVGD